MTRNRSVRASYRKKYSMGAGPYIQAVAYFSKLRLVWEEESLGWASGWAENEAVDIAVHMLKLLLCKNWDEKPLPLFYFIKDLPYDPCDDVTAWAAGETVGLYDYKYSGTVRGEELEECKVIFLNPRLKTRKLFIDTVFHEMIHHLCHVYPNEKYEREAARGRKHNFEFHAWVKKLSKTTIWSWGMKICSRCKMCPK